MVDYCARGERRAQAIGNRGPIRFDANGHLDSRIMDAYRTHGFYIFEAIIDSPEVDELRADVATILERAPTGPHAKTDALGRPAFGRHFAIDPYLFIKPLSDPWGGTDLLAGRHPTAMDQPDADPNAPDHVVHLIAGMCQAMPAGLRLYGHPDLLRVAASVNGGDFTPYNDVIFVKQGGVGGAVSWHQDGATHWDDPAWDDSIHGFNFQVQLHPTTAANALWVVPGSHRTGRIDIVDLVAANGGSDQLPQAVPLVCRAGDVTIVNRQMLHGSFVNSTLDPRISITFGFHRRSSVLGVEGKLQYKAGSDGGGGVYDADRIDRRSAVIPLAIDARAQHFPDEQRFVYEPFIGREDEHRFDVTIFDDVIRDYNTLDIFI